MENLKIYTASFYQVRNLEPNMIPMSTAVGEPAWFHDFKDNKHIFIDKRGVINGLIAKPFILDKAEGDKLFEEGQGCSKNCRFQPPDCPFMQLYRKNIEKTSFDDIITYLSNEAEKVRETLNFQGKPIIILLVYEHPSVQCAERVVIQNYFKDHGYEVKEWTPDLVYKTELF